MADEQLTYRYDYVDEGTGNRRRAIRTGSAWNKPLTFLENDKVTPKNISTWTFQMMVRQTNASDVVIIELSSANGKITMPGGGTDGVILLSLTAAETAALISLFTGDFEDEESYLAEYDLKYTEGGVVKDSIEGQIEIRASATRT